MIKLEMYRGIINALRRGRRLPDWKPETDRRILAAAEDLYAELTPAEQEIVEAKGWRSWPD